MTKVLLAAISDHLPSYPTKDGRVTNSYFILLGTHQCGILMVNAETTSVSLGVDLEAAGHPASTISIRH